MRFGAERAVRCGEVRCGAVRCGSVRCGAVRCGGVQCGAVRCGAGVCVDWCCRINAVSEIKGLMDLTIL